MIPPAFSAAEQSKRGRLFHEAAAQAAQSWYDPAGRWIGGKPLPDTRERYWLAFGLYHIGENAFADAIVREGGTDSTKDFRGYPSQFNIFWTNIAVGILATHGKKLSPEIRTFLENKASEALKFVAGDRTPDYQFHGYNDNMPSKASMGLILGGEMLDDPDAVEHGVYNLRQLRAQMTRRGIHSECNSPTYSAATLMGLNKIANYARNAEARELALAAEQRLWIDLAARFHPEMGLISGPYTRAYTVDVLGHMSNATRLLWFALGDIVRPSPLEQFDPESKLAFHHDSDMPFNISETCWYVSSHYHIPEKALELFAGKNYPFRAVATAEVGDAGPDSPAHAFRVESYLQRDFTLGTIDNPWLGSHQTASYFVTYKRREAIRSCSDVGTVYTKIVINDEAPGLSSERAVKADGTPYHEEVENPHVNSYSSYQVMQSDSTALVCTQPLLALGGDADPSIDPATGAVSLKGQKPLSRLSELVVFPSLFGGADEVIVGNVPRAGWEGPLAHGEWIAVRRGRLLIGLRPLVHTAEMGEPAIKLEDTGRHQFVRTTFYEGAPRLFRRAELRLIFGGFVAEHASVDDYGSLKEFAHELSRGKFTDFLFTTRRVRYRRPAGRLPTLEMELSWSPSSVTPRFALINGQLADAAALRIDTVENHELPFLANPALSIRGYFPWPSLQVQNFDQAHSTGDRES